MIKVPGSFQNHCSLRPAATGHPRLLPFQQQSLPTPSGFPSSLSTILALFLLVALNTIDTWQYIIYSCVSCSSPPPERGQNSACPTRCWFPEPRTRLGIRWVLSTNLLTEWITSPRKSPTWHWPGGAGTLINIESLAINGTYLLQRESVRTKLLLASISRQPERGGEGKTGAAHIFFIVLHFLRDSKDKQRFSPCPET